MTRIDTRLDDSVAADAIESRTQFDFVRYANCWEDADILVDALQAAAGKNLLSIASAGDNALALLATGANVVAADLNAAQLACVELRCAAFRNLDYEPMLAFLGVQATDDRRHTYTMLQHDLSPEASRYWDAHPELIATGIIHHGKFERYFQTFRKRVLPWIHSRRQIDHLLLPKSTAERQKFWKTTWNNRRWRTLLAIFFSRRMMGWLGRDPEFFRYVQGSISDQIQRRAEYALTELPTDSNPYLRYIATGNYAVPVALPRYLRAEHFEAIRSGIDRLTLFRGPIEQAAAVHSGSGFDGFNLSDIFEYVSDSTATQIYGGLLRHANPRARLAYWNAFVPRRCPQVFLNRVRSLEDASAAWFQQDRAFFYNHFQVDEVISTCPD